MLASTCQQRRFDPRAGIVVEWLARQDSGEPAAKQRELTPCAGAQSALTLSSTVSESEGGVVVPAERFEVACDESGNEVENFTRTGS